MKMRTQLSTKPWDHDVSREKETYKEDVKGVNRGMKDPEYVFLKRQHVDLGYSVNVIKLPMLPFATHKTYNEETNFAEDHIFDRTNTEENYGKIREIQLITAKLKNYQKRRASKGRSMSRTPVKKRELGDFLVNETRAGKLLCLKQKTATQVYPHAKEKCMFRKIEYPLLEKFFKNKRNLLTGRKQQERICIRRLYPEPETPPESQLSLLLMEKYSSLFDEESAFTALIHKSYM